MSSPSTTSSVIVGSGWFCALLVLGIIGADSTSTKSAGRARESADDVQPRRERAVPHAEDRRPEFVARRPVSPGPADPLESRPPATTPMHSVVPTAQPGPALPGSEPILQRPADSPRTAVPETVTQPVAPILTPGALSVAVHEPASATVAEPLEFVVRVQNSSETIAYGVTVTARFGPEWEFPGSDEHSTTLRLGELQQGGVCEAALSLTPLKAGPQQVEFEIASETHAQQLHTVKPAVRERLVEFDVAGPERRWTGQRAEYVVSLVNVSGRDLPDARVETTFNSAALTIREASTGVVTALDSLSWSLGPLLQGERVLIQFEFECRGESIAAPVECRFSTGGATVSQCRSPLEVLPPSPVEVTIVDRDDPLRTGQPAQFLVTVRNHSQQFIEDLSLRFSSSPHFEHLAVVPESASSASDSATDALGVNLHVGRLAPQAEVRYIATVRSVFPGDGRLRVLVQTKAVPAPFEYAESALITPAE